MSQYQSSPPASDNTGTTEKSIKSCYAVIYELKNRKWVVSGEGGWSECHLCLDTDDNSYRILAWTVKSQEVLMNCNVVGDCSYKEKSKNFHSFTDENGDRFGLGFHKSDSGLKQAQQFLKSVTSIIKSSKSSLPPPPQKSKPEHSTSASIVPPLGYQNSVEDQSKTIVKNNKSKKNDLKNSQIDENEPYNNNNHNNNSVKIDPKWHKDENGGYYDDEGYYYDENGKLKGYYDEDGYYFQYNEEELKEFNESNNQEPSKSNTKKYLKEKSMSKRNSKITIIPPPPPTQNESKNDNDDDYNNDNNNDQLYLNQSATSEAAYDKDDNENKINGDYNYNNFNNGNINNKLDIQNPKNIKHYGSIVTPNYHLDNKQYQSIPNQPVSNQLGNLKILPPKPSKLIGSDASIKNPNKVELKLRVTYNKETGVYDGLPKEWLKELNKQFGVSPKTLPGIKFNEYSAKVPTILVNLANSIRNKNGWKQVGIFRLAPNTTDNNKTKELINENGKLNLSQIDSTDVNVYANLIKVWFRDLPEPILNCIDPTRVELVNNQNDALQIIKIMPDPQKSIFLWLCDMCVDCSQYQKVNKMSSQNLAIVIGPNLFNTDNFENPMKAMTFSQKVVEFFKHAINERIGVAKKKGTYKLYK